jgi:hypothetical protein
MSVEQWMKGGVAGQLIGTFTTTNMYGENSLAEVYWINTVNDKGYGMVGLRYPDNSRLYVGESWLAWRDKEIQEKYKALKYKYMKLHGIKIKLKLRNRKDKPKQKLKLKLKEKPKLKLKG